MQLIQYKQLFIREARNRLKQIEDGLLALERDNGDRVSLDGVLSDLHILKSDAATMNYQNLANALHQTEEVLLNVRNGTRQMSPSLIDSIYIFIDAVRDDLEHIRKDNVEIDLDTAAAFSVRSDEKDMPAKNVPVTQSRDARRSDADQIYRPLSSYVEVSAEQMEDTFDMVNDLISQNQRLLRLARGGDTGALSIGVHSQATKLSELRRTIVDLKMMPVKQYFVFLSRLVRDLSRQGKKFVTFEMVDNNLRFEKQVLESLREVLVQLIKNAVEHGFIEGEKGTVSLRFEFKSNHIYVHVRDTGRGINWELIAKQAIKQKKVTRDALRRMTPTRRHQFLFERGVSSRESATLSSGHGIGWSAIRDTVKRLNGQVMFETESGRKKHGTTFVIEVPLPPTMFRALIWRWGSYHLALPLFVVKKIIQLPGEQSKKIGKRVRIQKRMLPVVSMSTVLNPDTQNTQEIVGAIAIVTADDHDFAVTLPMHVAEQELIIQKLPCLQKNKLALGVAVSEYSLPVIIINSKALYTEYV